MPTPAPRSSGRVNAPVMLAVPASRTIVATSVADGPIRRNATSAPSRTARNVAAAGSSRRRRWTSSGGCGPRRRNTGDASEVAPEPGVEVHDRGRVGGDGAPDRRRPPGSGPASIGTQVRDEVDDVVAEAQPGIRREGDVVVGEDGDDVLHAGAADPPVGERRVQAGAHAAGRVRRRGVAHVRRVGQAAAVAVEQDRGLERRPARRRRARPAPCPDPRGRPAPWRRARGRPTRPAARGRAGAAARRRRRRARRPARRAQGRTATSGHGVRMPQRQGGRRSERRGRGARRAAVRGEAPVRPRRVVPPTGFEPVISTLKGWRPRPLDDGGTEPPRRPAECTSQAPWVPLQIRLMITAAASDMQRRDREQAAEQRRHHGRPVAARRGPPGRPRRPPARPWPRTRARRRRTRTPCSGTWSASRTSTE